MVVIHHLILASVPSLAIGYIPGITLIGTPRLLFRTPLHIFWAGPEFVIVFFVLSGLVLSRAAARGESFTARSFYPSRLTRLYLPVWGALALAAVCHIAVSHAYVPGASFWLDRHSVPLKLHWLLMDASLNGTGDRSFTTVLWSLHWEIVFSLLLPVFLLAARRIPPALLAALALAVVTVGGTRFAATHYLPAFTLGVALAFGERDVRAWMTRRRGWYLLVIGAITLTADAWVPQGHAHNLGLGLEALGATLLVAVAMCPGVSTTLFARRPILTLGSRSFSLYLVHEPIIVAIAFALGGRPSIIALAAVAIPVIAVVTEIFYRLVERPSHRLARLAGGYLPERATAALSLSTVQK